MTPSEPGAPGPVRESAWSGVWLTGKDFPAGVTDPAVLARLANEFFNALPDIAQASSIVPSASSQLRSVPAAEPLVNPESNIATAPPAPVPMETELRARPEALVWDFVPPLPVSGGIPTSLPTIAGDFAAIRSSDLPSFSFLEEARPIFANSTATLSSLARCVSGER